eukprot:g68799.t1
MGNTNTLKPKTRHSPRRLGKSDMWMQRALKKFDLVVIGGGSGGSATAKRAAGYGAKVCIIERGVKRDEYGARVGAGVGGTCVNVGCVPKKLMYMAAAHREIFEGGSATAAGYGFSLAAPIKFDWAGLKKRRDAYVARLNNVYESGWKSAGIEVVSGYATFQDPRTVLIKHEDGATSTVQADHVLVAVGGHPSYPPNTPGARELCITSDGFFDLNEQPKKALIIGAGYIAVEMAGILHALGTDTSLAFRGETVLRHGFDPFVVETLMEEMQKHGPHLYSNAVVDKVERMPDATKTVTLKDGRVVAGLDCVMFAIGRTPATAGLGLDKAGVATDKKGLIIVDQYENTNVPGVYALGDVTNTGWELTPVAIAAGRRLGDRLFGGAKDARIPYDRIPTVIFSHPPIGTVGMTEPDAIKYYGKENITVKKARFGSMLYAFNEEKEKVKTGLKLVLYGPQEKVVGLHMIGPYSDEMLQGFSIAVKMGATRHDFESAVAIHPTIAEEMVTFGGWGQVNGKPHFPAPNLVDETKQAHGKEGKQQQQQTSDKSTSSTKDESGNSGKLVAAFVAGGVVATMLTFVSSLRRNRTLGRRRNRQQHRACIKAIQVISVNGKYVTAASHEATWKKKIRLKIFYVRCVNFCCMCGFFLKRQVRQQHIFQVISVSPPYHPNPQFDRHNNIIRLATTATTATLTNNISTNHTQRR